MKNILQKLYYYSPYIPIIGFITAIISLFSKLPIVMRKGKNGVIFTPFLMWFTIQFFCLMWIELFILSKLY